MPDRSDKVGICCSLKTIEGKPLRALIKKFGTEGDCKKEEYGKDKNADDGENFARTKERARGNAASSSLFLDIIDIAFVLLKRCS